MQCLLTPNNTYKKDMRYTYLKDTEPDIIISVSFSIPTYLPTSLYCTTFQAEMIGEDALFSRIFYIELCTTLKLTHFALFGRVEERGKEKLKLPTPSQVTSRRRRRSPLSSFAT